VKKVSRTIAWINQPIYFSADESALNLEGWNGMSLVDLVVRHLSLNELNDLQADHLVECAEPMAICGRHVQGSMSLSSPLVISAFAGLVHQ